MAMYLLEENKIKVTINLVNAALQTITKSSKSFAEKLSDSI